MSDILKGVGSLMIIIGILIMLGSLDEARIVFYQVVILGAIFFGLGIVVMSVGILNSSIKEQTTFLSDRLDKVIKK